MPREVMCPLLGLCPQHPQAARIGRDKNSPGSKNMTRGLQETLILKMKREDKINFHAVSEEMLFNPGKYSVGLAAGLRLGVFESVHSIFVAFLPKYVK